MSHEIRAPMNGVIGMNRYVAGNQFACFYKRLKIRGIEKTHNGAGDVRTKVFVITSSDSIWDWSDLVLDNLCDEYIVKPFCRGALLTDLHKNILVDHPRHP